MTYSCIPYVPSILPLSTYPTEVCTYVHHGHVPEYSWQHYLLYPYMGNTHL